MSAEIRQQTNIGLTDEQLNELSKIAYGLTDKDIKELMVFIDEFNEAGLGVNKNPSYEDLKPVIDSGNKIPSHCGFMIMSYYANRNGEDALISLIEKLYNVYLQFDNDKNEESKKTDIYETLACTIMFSQHYIIRKFLEKDIERAKKIVNIMIKRPATASVLMSCLSELYLIKKDSSKYAEIIATNLQNMLNFLATKNGITNEVPDAVNINFNDLRDIIADYIDKGNKKESLSQINKLINKKADIGQAFFDWIVAGPSTAGRVIEENDIITEDVIETFIKQMKVQHATECLLILSNYVGQKLNKSIIYVKNVYKLENIEDYYDKLHSLVKKGGMYHYGILLRHIDLMPKILIRNNVISIGDLNSLQRKLSTIENNLTADISEKSMSITIAPLGRSRIYQDICDRINGIGKNDDNETSSFVAKLRDKNIVKKIRESGISYFAIDQYSGSIIIKCLESMKNTLQNTPNISLNDLIQESYKQNVKHYKIIQTLEDYRRICTTLIQNQQDANEDYE